MISQHKGTMIGGLLTMLSVAILWMSLGEVSGTLRTNLDAVRYPLEFLESPYAYLYLMLFSLFFPFVLSFDRKVHYVGSWKYLVAVIIWISSLYILWDVLFTKWGIWEFTEGYVSGIRIWGLPLEEISFFLVVPFACIFIYECVTAYSLRAYIGRLGSGLMRILITLGLGVSAIYFGGYYTSTVFIVLLAAWLVLEVGYSQAVRQNIYITLLLSYIPFMLINGLLTGWSTERPIVIYNDVQNLPWRLGSIPIDDAVYQAGMMIWMLLVYRGAKKSKKIFYFF
ncbi:MAG: lycopene cyclase domain-containing protein [Bacteroidetes bacterium]|jgi:lycopene cyclase domain-containing protein|nr:lycopene cyclase domain-containing protein [Bacteroidota bacterium]